jgi:hypothetical protein
MNDVHQSQIAKGHFQKSKILFENINLYISNMFHLLPMHCMPIFPPPTIQSKHKIKRSIKYKQLLLR